MSVADSLYNLQLVQDFCASRLPRGCPLSLEDLLYVPPPLKVKPSRGALGAQAGFHGCVTGQLTILPASRSTWWCC